MDWYSFILNEVFVGLVEMLFGFNVNIGGQISIGEMIIAVWFVFNFQKFSQIPNYRQYLVMYLCLIGAQIFSEVFVSSSFNNSLRGILVSVFSLIHFTFLLYYFHKKPQTIVATFVGAILATAIFGDFSEVDSDSLMAGDSAGLMKMKVAPMFSYLLVIISIYLNRVYLTPLFCYSGILVIALGARNAGVILFVTGLIGYFASTNKVINTQYLYGVVIILFICSGIAYYFYVDSVLSGKLSSGNNYVLLSLDNPYNPFELLYRSRTPVFVGFKAFMDKFWFGHGSWALDPDCMYRKMIYEANNLPIRNLVQRVIPTHSVLVGWGTFNGIFAFLAGLRLVIEMLKEGFLSLKSQISVRSTTKSKKFNTFSFCIAFCILSITWNILFSPLSHFRLSQPIYMAIIAYCFAQRNQCLHK